MNNLILKLGAKIGFGWAYTIIYGAIAAIILGSLMYCYHWAAENGRNEIRVKLRVAENDLKDYKSQQKVLTDTAMIENAKKLEQASLKVKQAVKSSDETLAKFNLANIDRSQLTEKVRLLNASINQNESIAARTRANLNDSVRLSASRDGAAASQKSSAASKLSAADSNAAIVRQACQLTTIDLVKAYAIIEADTMACGREK